MLTASFTNGHGSDMKTVLIDIKGVSKRFYMGKTEVHALREINLEIMEGEYLSVMGPSGSGKSTLFNMIGALDHPTTGAISIAGHTLSNLTARQLAHFRGNFIGYIFQSYNLLPAYDALTNVMMPLMFCGWEQGKATTRAREVLEKVGLGHRITHRPDELSGGQQQRVAIARALANEPCILLADEPTANLDLHTGEEIINLMRQLCTELGVTVISATHDHKMLACSDRVLWIKDGQIDRLEKRENLAIKTGSIGGADA